MSVGSIQIWKYNTKMSTQLTTEEAKINSTTEEAKIKKWQQVSHRHRVVVVL